MQNLYHDGGFATTGMSAEALEQYVKGGIEKDFLSFPRSPSPPCHCITNG